MPEETEQAKVLREFADLQNWTSAVAPMGDPVSGWCGSPEPWLAARRALEANAAENRRLSGVVSSVHADPGEYGGQYGAIVGDDGKSYVWSSGNVFRDMTQMRVGLRVSFEAVNWSYAGSITSRGVKQGSETR